MLRKLLSVIVVLLVGITSAYAQSGALKGKIIDKATSEPVPFVNLILMNKGTQAGGSSSDIDGNYTIKPITPGTYDLIATFVGYKKITITGLVIRADKTEIQNISMESTTKELDEVEITYTRPLIDKDNTVTQSVVTKEEIAKMPVRNASAIASTVGGVFSRDGEIGSIRGGRSGGNVTYVDGIKVIGTSSLPERAIEQVSVILGGVPAQYGDATGGIINVTTRGPSREFNGGLEFETSQLLDPYGHNRLGLNLTGPLLWKRDKDTRVKKSSILGYFLATDFTYDKDGSPLSIGTYYAKDSILQALQDSPLRSTNSGGNYPNVLFINKDNLYHSKSTLNTAQLSVNSTLKFDIKTSTNSTLVIGGSINYNKGRNFNRYQSMFNYDRNNLSTSKTWRTFARYTHTFPNSTNKDNKGKIKNVYFSIQGDYSHYDDKTMDADLQDNLFSYGYIGRFDTYKSKQYTVLTDTLGTPTGMIMTGWRDTLVTFERSEINPYMANYTSNYYNLVNNPADFNTIYSGGGLLNGYTANDVFGGVYGLWSVPGNPQSGSNLNSPGYTLNFNDQISANLNISGDLGDHELKFGYIFEKSAQSNYGYSPISFWTLMYQYTNAHIAELDDTPIYSYYLDEYGDTLVVTDFARKYDSESQKTIDKNLRKAMGLAENGTEWIDVNSYNMNDHTIYYYDKNNVRQKVELNKPLSVDMFSPDELLNTYSSNTSVAYARGYDYYGNKISSADRPSIRDFFQEKDANGNYTRRRASFEPIYMAVYGQDKFTFEDLVFNIGVRVDRFDANQSVLADPYVLYPTIKAGEDKAKELGAKSFVDPNAVVYVDDVNNPTKIVGYRLDNVWMNSNGTQIQDPSLSVSTGGLDAGNGISPLLVNASESEAEFIDERSFKDYVPQFSFMPRISFSFPISDEALFYAHYDVLTQRPSGANTFNPIQILNWVYNGNITMNNPNLRPEKTIDYELGFQQKLNKKSSLVISLFYREFRDQIQIYRYTGAYPSTYYSFNNIDFGTVKGLTAAYDLRRSGNARVRASYTLQFANGTGSDQNTAEALIKSNQPNLRTLFPYDYDQRHAFNLSLDYRWGEGKEYNGPTWGKKDTKWLQNTGFNVTFRGGSGTPYTKSSNISPFGQNDIIAGSINGSRLPWSFRMDARLDKDFIVAQTDKRTYYMNVYLQVLNVLNTKNIMNVYAATGNPDDDGYLAAAEYQSTIEGQVDVQSYRDLYSIAVNSPYNYSSPRMIRIGIGLNF